MSLTLGPQPRGGSPNTDLRPAAPQPPCAARATSEAAPRRGRRESRSACLQSGGAAPPPSRAPRRSRAARGRARGQQQARRRSRRVLETRHAGAPPRPRRTRRAGPAASPSGGRANRSPASRPAREARSRTPRAVAGCAGAAVSSTECGALAQARPPEAPERRGGLGARSRHHRPGSAGARVSHSATAAHTWSPQTLRPQWMDPCQLWLQLAVRAAVREEPGASQDLRQPEPGHPPERQPYPVGVCTCCAAVRVAPSARRALCWRTMSFQVNWSTCSELLPAVCSAH